MFSFCLKFLIKLSENVGEADTGDLDFQKPRNASVRLRYFATVFNLTFAQRRALIENNSKDADRIKEKVE